MNSKSSSYMQLPQVYPVASHTNRVGKGSTFVAIAGKNQDGHDYILQALERGATKIVVDYQKQMADIVIDAIDKAGAQLILVKDCRKAIAQLAAQAVGYPAEKLKLIGLTGTKGKTSTAYMIHHILASQGKKVALISTAEKLIGNHPIPMDLTTPLPEDLHMFFALCVQQDVEYVVMEVSAQAISLHRVDGLRFYAGAFTNFSLEHLEFYPTMQDYLQAKVEFLSMIDNPARLFINIDDLNGQKIAQNNRMYMTYGSENREALWHIDFDIKQGSIGIKITGVDQSIVMQSHLVGQFNGYNLAVAALITHALGISFESIAQAVTTIFSIPGRMENYPLASGALCIIDYAHNPSSYQAVLSTLAGMTNYLTIIFGAGGQRDATKRPIMAALVEKYAQEAIVTSDNPRTESAEKIAQDIIAGFTGRAGFRFSCQLDRALAIENACLNSVSGQIIAILGKGRDEYQIIGTQILPFKEKAFIQPFMADKPLYKSL